MQIPQHVLNSYAIGNIASVNPVSIGLIHKTYALETDKGEYILQSLHPVLASNEVAEDFAAVLEHLAHASFNAPSLIRTIGGDILAKHDGIHWRMQTKLSGKTVETLSTTEEARAAGLQ